MDSSQWDTQEKLRIIDVNRVWYHINVIEFKNCFYRQRIKLPQLQSMYFLLSSGGHWRNCVVLYGYCYVFSWLGGVAVARGLKF